MLAAAISLDRPSSTMTWMILIPAGDTGDLNVVLALLGDCFSKASVP